MQYLGRQSDEAVDQFRYGRHFHRRSLARRTHRHNERRSLGEFPVSVPMVDMHTIGAGGGSIAYVDSGGMLQVGPESAGADPGPVCYGKGGTRPTETDANLLLGRLPAGSPLAGGLELDIDLARRPWLNSRTRSASTSRPPAGNRQHRQRTWSKPSAASRSTGASIPPEFLLVSFGGAGGLHVCALAEALGIRHAVVPVYAGVLSRSAWRSPTREGSSRGPCSD